MRYNPGEIPTDNDEPLPENPSPELPKPVPPLVFGKRSKTKLVLVLLGFVALIVIILVTNHGSR
jgi:hypothetical protein